MWLASASFRNAANRIIGTGNWSPEMYRRAENALANVLVKAGDPGRERLFRMNITLCLHRALNERERDRLPASFFAAPGGMAGGPIEILRVTGLSPRAAALPCEAPVRELIDRERPDLWLPVDCAACPPCRARLEIRGEQGDGGT